MDKAPIFVGITRSFWFTVAGMAALFGAGDDVLLSAGALIERIPMLAGLGIGAFLVDAAPVVLWFAAMRERAGASRPYTINPKAVT